MSANISVSDSIKVIVMNTANKLQVQALSGELRISF